MKGQGLEVEEERENRTKTICLLIPPHLHIPFWESFALVAADGRLSFIGRSEPSSPTADGDGPSGTEHAGSLLGSPEGN